MEWQRKRVQLTNELHKSCCFTIYSFGTNKRARICIPVTVNVTLADGVELKQQAPTGGSLIRFTDTVSGQLTPSLQVSNALEILLRFHLPY